MAAGASANGCDTSAPVAASMRMGGPTVDAPESLSSALSLSPFSLPVPGDPGLSRATLMARPLGRRVERFLALPALQRLYAQAQHRPESQFSDRALGVLDISYTVHGDPREIPRSGPAIIVANHPFGALDGLILSSLLARERNDARLLANQVLGLVPELREQMVLVDVSGGGHATGRNGRRMREAVRWVRDGGCLCLFPAGVVSHFNWRSGRVTDPAWHRSLGALVRLTRAPVVPCFIEGANSLLFQLAGTLHPGLRTLLLPRELLRRRGTHVDVHVGRAISPSRLAGDDQGVTAFLRSRTYVDARAGVKREVAALMRDQSLVRAESLAVFWAQASQAPRLLQEVGREREVAFRAVKEGTGREIDLDDFDQRYLHLCVWDEQRNELAGAYRMRTVESCVSATDDGAGLYTRTLFRFDCRLISALAPAIELGRAFVRAPYQKQYAPLMLLWAGIGRFVARHPRYRHLFGALSIGSAYSPAARAAMIAYLRRHAYDPRLARLVSPRNPPFDAMPHANANPAPDLVTLNAAVEALDAGHKGVPVLLRQYLKLNARVLGFNIDPAFSHVLDALVVVDLARAPRTLLARYMGHEQARVYLAHHGVLDAPGPAEDEARWRRSA